MTDGHWWKMVKKGHPSPGFELAPLEGSKKVMNFCLKLYYWATFYWKEYRIVWYQWKESRINYTYLQFTEIVWKNGKCSFSLNSLAQSENCLWYGLICIKTSVKSGSKESKLFKKLTFMLWQVWRAFALEKAYEKHCLGKLYWSLG